MKKVTGTVIHWVGGDGLDIMTVMVAMRILDLLLDRILGRIRGWLRLRGLLFQIPVLENMGDDWTEALWKGGVRSSSR